MQRVVIYTNADGAVCEKEISNDALIVVPSALPRAISDSAVPMDGRLLAEIAAAAMRRLAERNEYLEG